MKGSTNALMGGGAVVQGEKVNLILNTNQTAHNDLIGVLVKVSYGGHEEEYTWNGNAMTITVPAYAPYTISFGEVDGYKRPDAISFEAVEGNSRSYTATYLTERVVVNVSVDDGSPVGEQVVTIDGKYYVYNETPVSALVPFGKEYTVSVSGNSNYITPEPQTFVASMVTRNVEMVYSSAVDLSGVDIYGNLIAQTTANCYVVKEAGKYRFPIAYGAAIKNGAVNTAAFTNNGGENSHDFVNYKGNVIASPYIETDTATQAASVQMSISDMENAVTDLEIVEGDGCRHVQFSVSEVPSVGANAVISVKDASGVIMWNWHIWLWGDSLAVEEITNSGNVKYKILPVNLGSKWDDSAKTHIKNWFYQFGRPTPQLCPSAYNSTSNHVSYGALNYVVDSIAQDLSIGIQNPTTFYKKTSGSYSNWFSTNAGRTYNLWDAECKSTGNADNNVIKTVYDPCPPGFKMPNGNTFTYFTNRVGGFEYGCKFKRYSGDTIGVFFPASGYRTSNSGLSSGVSSSGFVWLSSSYTIDNAYRLGFSANNTNIRSGGSRADGYSVRPVQDADLQLATHKLTINVSGDTSTPSGYEVKVYSVIESTDETTGETTVTLGDVLATQTTASATHEITWETKYRIVASGVDGFTTPSDVDYTADMEFRTVLLVYMKKAGTLNPGNGVYIQDTDGYFHTTDEWTGNYTPNGIAVITSNCRFVMALVDAYSGRCEWSSYVTIVSGITTETSATNAVKDYDGEAQTTVILNQLGNNPTDAPAAYYCRTYTFPNGSIGYLGTAGEWQAALDNKFAIDSALSKCGGAAMNNWYWASTQASSDRSWYMHWVDEVLHTYYKNSNYYVRAFAAI